MTTNVTSNKQTRISKDVENKRLIIVREFDAPLHQVWEAWTKSDLLDQWWAPKPWRAETKTMDFREGGRWLYCMVGPDDSKTWCKVVFNTIEEYRSFTADDAFCDEEGNINTDLPVMRWKNDFFEMNSGTKVQVEISFSSVADLEKIIELGFEEGFTAALGNLDELFIK
jgi:uncharacterized protein YndB with AHSA1/START domain